MTEEERVLLTNHLQSTVTAAISRLRRAYVGRSVRLNRAARPSKAKGREAIVDGVIVDSSTGEPLFLCMVIAAFSNPEDKRMLNSDGWTRSYRRWEEFELLSERTERKGQTFMTEEQVERAHDLAADNSWTDEFGCIRA